jgi:hypothetical protein
MQVAAYIRFRPRAHRFGENILGHTILTLRLRTLIAAIISNWATQSVKGFLWILRRAGALLARFGDAT